MNITDERLKARALRAIALQEQGEFVLDYRKELPLPAIELRYSRDYDEQRRFYDYETAWGKFSHDPQAYGLLVLSKGNPPAELLPQPRIQLVTGTVHTGYVSIHNNGKSFDLDFPTRDALDYQTLHLLNKTLVEERLPLVAWELDEVPDETPPVIRITNDSAMLFASSAIWDMDDQQLVAAQVVTTSQELLKAIKATLANNNSKSYLTVKTPDDSAFLKGARKGFVCVAGSLAQANAEGTVTALLHPLSGDPQAQTAEHFYLVVAPGESISDKFAQRLDLSIPWPVQKEWADYLLETGQSEGLVSVLPSCGSDFSAGLRISKNESRWQQVITAGLKQGSISIQ